MKMAPKVAVDSGTPADGRSVLFGVVELLGKEASVGCAETAGTVAVAECATRGMLPPGEA